MLTAGARDYPWGPHTVAQTPCFCTNHRAAKHSMCVCAKEKATFSSRPCGETDHGALWPRRADVRGLVEKGGMAFSLRIFANTEP
jgi:hypothetical protein